MWLPCGDVAGVGSTCGYHAVVRGVGSTCGYHAVMLQEVVCAVAMQECYMGR